jgi:hypothetical protein
MVYFEMAVEWGPPLSTPLLPFAFAAAVVKLYLDPNSNMAFS